VACAPIVERRGGGERPRRDQVARIRGGGDGEKRVVSEKRDETALLPPKIKRKDEKYKGGPSPSKSDYPPGKITKGKR